MRFTFRALLLAALLVALPSRASSHISLALDYVVYRHADGTSLTREVAEKNIQAINEAYSVCDMSFEIEKFATVSPSEKGLADGPATLGELDRVRQVFGSDSELLVVTTGHWGSVKSAWTQPPEAPIHGAVLEDRAGSYPPIIGHELGHYLGLTHASNDLNLMNPVVYATAIDPGQCSRMRATAERYWKRMYR